MKTIKTKVHMLPTEDKTDIFKIKDLNIFHLRKNMYQFDDTKTDLISIHLYITTDEEIKEGDCFYYNHNGGVIGQYRNPMGEVDGKIIATTDSKLKKECSGCRFHRNSGDIIYTCSCEKLPQIPQSFIEEYCKAGGIDEVLVEYIEDADCGGSMCRNGCISYSMSGEFCSGYYTTPKLNPDNTIIIHPVWLYLTFKEKMYSREEVENLLHKAIVDYSNGYSSPSSKWIEENL